jgi:(2R)-3-sulfolactate dehydrogenase (NADP+)
VAKIAERGLLGLGFAHSPASVALPGLPQKIFGTNPFAFAVPGPDGPLMIVDQSTSAVTKTEVVNRHKAGQPLDPGMAQDRAGTPTTDAGAALEGAILPNGGRKGGHVALLVEVLAAALTGATPSILAPSLGGMEGGQPDLGQFFIAIDPARFGAGDGFAAAVAGLAASLTQAEGQRLPGARRRAALAHSEADGVVVDAALLSRIRALSR